MPADTGEQGYARDAEATHAYGLAGTHAAAREMHRVGKEVTLATLPLNHERDRGDLRGAKTTQYGQTRAKTPR